MGARPTSSSTATSVFGVGRRESHDASGFYARFRAPVVDNDERVTPASTVDALWTGDARHMDAHGDVEDGSVALVVTSPPYFAGKEYEAVLGQGHVPADYAAYLDMLHDVFAQCVTKLEPGGRIAVNVANLGRKPYRSLAADVITILQDLGLLLRGEIIWRKSLAAGGSCAWGSYQRPTNPVLRDTTERIVVASKGRFDRALSAEARRSANLPHQGTITMDEFVDATTDVWELAAESATRVGHPAPFPIELPQRLIELFTYRHDLVLDPFVGSGTTAVAAVRTERHYVGFDTDPDYIALAEQRVAEERASSRAVDSWNRPIRPLVTVGPGRTAAPDVRAPLDDLQSSGHKARDIAEAALVQAGFHGVERGVAFGDLGTAVDFRALDRTGRPWLFLLAGAFSSTRPGLRRAETMWRCLGVAAVLQAGRSVDRRPLGGDLGPVILLSTDLPPARSAGAKALATAMGPGGTIAAAIELATPDGARALAQWASGSSPSGPVNSERSRKGD